MCDKKIQHEEKFFYKPGGPEYDEYIIGDKECEGCPHRTVPWEIILITEKYIQEKYGCRGLQGFRGPSVELRMYGSL